VNTKYWGGEVEWQWWKVQRSRNDKKGPHTARKKKKRSGFQKMNATAGPLVKKKG